MVQEFCGDSGIDGLARGHERVHLVHALDVASSEALACFRLQLLALCAQEWEGESGAGSGEPPLRWPGPPSPRGQGSPRGPGGRPRRRQYRGAGRGGPQAATRAGWANAPRAPPPLTARTAPQRALHTPHSQLQHLGVLQLGLHLCRRESPGGVWGIGEARPRSEPRSPAQRPPGARLPASPRRPPAAVAAPGGSR